MLVENSKHTDLYMVQNYANITSWVPRTRRQQHHKMPKSVRILEMSMRQKITFEGRHFFKSPFLAHSGGQTAMYDCNQTDSS